MTRGEMSSTKKEEEGGEILLPTLQAVGKRITLSVSFGIIALPSLIVHFCSHGKERSIVFDRPN